MEEQLASKKGQTLILLVLHIWQPRDGFPQ
jgi:hypothetical protein